MPVYTGDIGEEVLNRQREYSSDDQEIEFTKEQHAIWADLFARVDQPHFNEHISREYHRGKELLDLDPTRIPTVAALNEQITPRVGWMTQRTAVRYTQPVPWYEKFARRIFLITDYLRTREQLEFTPEPDMFHDIVGHLPYLTLDFYAELEDKFAPAFLRATAEEREVVKRLAWYSTEFGLVMEENKIKVFGAGIISGRAELANTIMEIYRLDRDNITDYRGDLFEQLSREYASNSEAIDAIMNGISDLHVQGKMSSESSGWNVVDQLFEEQGIDNRGYLGGNVIIAPFTVENVSRIPKTVYALNPILFLAESFEQMSEELDSFFEPIYDRPLRGD